eukprot:m.400440 g.400440  ORF g.400440 m.400440 type:complete len:202 (-) comp21159_c0_seq20:683-1288(-)
MACVPCGAFFDVHCERRHEDWISVVSVCYHAHAPGHAQYEQHTNASIGQGSEWKRIVACEENDGEYLLTAAAIRFLVQATNGSDPRPFFLGMGHHRPHLPYVGVACCPPPLLRPSSGTVQCESIPSRVLVTCTHTHTLTHSHTHASDRSPTAVLSRYTPTHTLIHTRTALYGCMRITHIKQQYERFAQMHHAQSQSGRLCS